MFNKKVNVTIDIQAKNVLLGERERRGNQAIKFSKFYIEMHQLPIITLGNYLPIAYTAVTEKTNNLSAYFKTTAEAEALREQYRNAGPDEVIASVTEKANDELSDFEDRFQTDYQVMVAKGEVRNSFIYNGEEVYVSIHLEEVETEVTMAEGVPA